MVEPQQVEDQRKATLQIILKVLEKTLFADYLSLFRQAETFYFFLNLFLLNEPIPEGVYLIHGIRSKFLFYKIVRKVLLYLIELVVLLPFVKFLQVMLHNVPDEFGRVNLLETVDDSHREQLYQKVLLEVQYG